MFQYTQGIHQHSYIIMDWADSIIAGIFSNMSTGQLRRRNCQRIVINAQVRTACVEKDVRLICGVPGLGRLPLYNVGETPSISIGHINS